MQKLEFEIKTHCGMEKRKGYVVPNTDGLLATHKAEWEPKWSVTHVPTGYALCWKDTRQQAANVGAMIFREAKKHKVSMKSSSAKWLRPRLLKVFIAMGWRREHRN
jgi:hypothetical protein